MPKRPCLGCGKPTAGSWCTSCQAPRTAERDQRRGTTTQRGLGWRHQQQRQRLIDQAGPLTECPRCGQPITKDNPISGEHGIPRAHGGTEVSELICRRCNSSSGAKVRRHRQ